MSSVNEWFNIVSACNGPVVITRTGAGTALSGQSKSPSKSTRTARGP